MDTGRMQTEPRGVDVSAVSLRQLAPALVAGLPDLLDEVGELLMQATPDYGRFLVASRDEVVMAAEEVMQRLLTLTESGLPAQADSAESAPDVPRVLFEEIGRIQCRQGVPLRRLLSAYQLGARVAWRHLSSTALRGGVEPLVLAALAEALFFFVDQLCSASAGGYVAEQTEAGAARERLREELAELLFSDRSGTDAVRGAAARAAWRLPAEAAVVFVQPDDELGRTMLSRLDPSFLPVRRPGLLGTIVPDPSAPGRRRTLATALRGSSAVIGPTVALDELPASARIAEEAAQMRRSGALRADPLFVDEHLDGIIVHRDQQLLQALRQQVLTPLNAATPASQAALRDTLRCWLRHMGDRQAVAAELHIHPQTVRYRLGRLHQLFGPSLDDPACRRQLVLALLWDPEVRVPPTDRKPRTRPPTSPTGS